MANENGQFPPEVHNEHEKLQQKWQAEDDRQRRADLVDQATELLSDAPLGVLGRVVRNIALAPEEDSTHS